MHRSVIQSFLPGHAPKAADLERLGAEAGVSTHDTLVELEQRDLVWREVTSRKAVSGEPVRVLVARDGTARPEPADLVVIAGRTGDGPSKRACCPHLNFVPDRARAAELLAATVLGHLECVTLSYSSQAFRAFTNS